MAEGAAHGRAPALAVGAPRPTAERRIAGRSPGSRIVAARPPSRSSSSGVVGAQLPGHSCGGSGGFDTPSLFAPALLEEPVTQGRGIARMASRASWPRCRPLRGYSPASERRSLRACAAPRPALAAHHGCNQDRLAPDRRLLRRTPPARFSRAPVTRRGRASASVAAVRERAPARLGAQIATLAAAIAVPAMAAPAEWSPVRRRAAARRRTDAVRAPRRELPGSAFYYLPTIPMPALRDRGRYPLRRGTRRCQRSATSVPRSLPRARCCRRQPRLDRGRRAVLLTPGDLLRRRRASPTPDSARSRKSCSTASRTRPTRTPCAAWSIKGSERAHRVPVHVHLRRQRWRASPPPPCGTARSEWPSRRLSGAVYNPVGLATHYHTVQVHPYWADSLDRLGTIGAHIFYRWRGAAGRPAAFRFAYAGGEPAAARIRAAPRSPTTRRSIRWRSRAPTKSAIRRRPRKPRTTPAPSYSPNIAAQGGDALFTGERLPTSGSVRDEYAQSGQ